MATTAKNTIVRSPAPYAPIEDMKNFLTTSLTFNQGDLLALDTTNHCVKVIAADGDTAAFIGVAMQSIKNGLLSSPYTTSVDSNQGQTNFVGPMAGVEATCILNSGDTFHPGDKVYPIGASGGTQTVSTSSNSSARKPCGYYMGAQVTATSGSTGPIRLEAQFPYAWT